MERRTVDLTGIVFEYGEGPHAGPTLLYLHGFPGAWDQHPRLLETLSASFHVVAVSLPGFGRSGRRDDYSVASWIEDTRQFISLKFDGPVLGIGYSSGAWFGLGAASIQPELFSAFVVLDMPLNPRDHLDPARTATLQAIFGEVVDSTSDADLADRLAGVTLATGQSYADVTTREQRLADANDLRQHDPGIFRGIVDDGIESFVKDPVLDAWPGEFDRPILFIYGDHDSGSLVDEAGAAFNRERYPWATEMRFPGRDHGLGLVDDPDPVIEAIATWIASLD